MTLSHPMRGKDHPMSEPPHSSIMKNVYSLRLTMLYSLGGIRILAALHIRYFHNYTQRSIRIKAGVC